MKLWIGAETQAEVTESFRSIRSEVERAINAAIDSFKTDIGVDSWDCVVILREDVHLPEVIKVSKARRDMDFRLQLDYQAFLKSDAPGRKQLLFALLLRSLTLLKHKTGLATEVDQLTKLVRAVGERQKWLPKERKS